MGLSLSAQDVRAVQATSEALLSLVDHPDTMTWGPHVMRVAAPLLQADRMLLALPSVRRFEVVGSDPELAETQQACVEPYHKLDVFLGEQRRALGLEVLAQEILVSEGDTNTEFWTDWILRYRVCEPAGIAINVPGVPVPAAFMGYRETPGTQSFAERGRVLFSLLKPSFHAAVRSLLLRKSTKAELLAHIDELPSAIVLFDASGSIAHANAAFRRRFGHCSSRLIAAVSPGRPGRAGAPPQGKVRISSQEEVSYFALLWTTQAGARATLVQFEELWPRVPSARSLQARFGFTRRQAQVARLLAMRRSNGEIAEALVISPHTAKRHTEAVMSKLDAESRRQVEGLLTESDA